MSENYATSPRITVFPATLNRFTATPITEKRKRRVAAYTRVSTNSDEQKISYEAQVSYYTDYISAKPDWDFVQVYADKGITGTSTKHREHFNEMIADALAGKIDQFLGYRKGENGEPEIVPKEAEVVRRIYRLFLDGMTPYKIKLTLENEGALSPSGRSTWQPRTVLSILTNEKYKGDALLQKTFCTDFLTKKNEGQRGQGAAVLRRKQPPGHRERRCLRGGAAGIGATKKARPPTQQPALLLRENLLRLLWQRVRQQGLAFQRQIPTHRLAMQRPVRQRNWMPNAAPERTDD